MYHALLRGLEDTRAGKTTARQNDYSGDLVPLLYISLSARGVIGIFTAMWFGLIGLVAFMFPEIPLEGASVAGLVLGWTGVLGIITSLVRHLCWWLLRKRERFLMRTRIAEPWRWDFGWQVAVAYVSALAVTP